MHLKVISDGSIVTRIRKNIRGNLLFPYIVSSLVSVKQKYLEGRTFKQEKTAKNQLSIIATQCFFFDIFLTL